MTFQWQTNRHQFERDYSLLSYFLVYRRPPVILKGKNSKGEKDFRSLSPSVQPPFSLFLLEKANTWTTISIVTFLYNS